MGAGKTTLGKRLSKKLHRSFIDTDHFISEQEQSSIEEIIKNEGMAYFRQLESDTLNRIKETKNKIVSTGGGFACSSSNINIMNDTGITLYLQYTPGELFNRLQRAKKERPLLLNMQPKEKMFFIRNLLLEREKYYKQAHHTLYGESLKFIKILDLIKHNNY